MTDSAPPTGWVADLEPNERFTIYPQQRRRSVPHVMTALTGTLIGDQVRQVSSPSWWTWACYDRTNCMVHH